MEHPLEFAGGSTMVISAARSAHREHRHRDVGRVESRSGPEIREFPDEGIPLSPTFGSCSRR
jgi:hypothetical protein